MSNVTGQTYYVNVCIDCENWGRSFDFNSVPDSTEYYFTIDSTQPNNIWQHGVLNKAYFTSGYEGLKAFVTDTINPYPVNNKSSFKISVINCNDMTSCYGSGYWGWGFGVYYKIDSDINKDGGTIEISHNGSPFKNVINDSMIYYSSGLYSLDDTIHSLGMPGYSGLSENWNSLYVQFWAAKESNDTTTLRFTFASDSIQTNKDGWIIGRFEMIGAFEGIEEIRNDNLISIYPNPACDKLIIDRLVKSGSATVEILNSAGQVLYKISDFSADLIDINQLKNGMYFLRFTDDESYAVKKFVVKK